MTFVIDITGTDDLQNAKVASWDLKKTLKIQVNNSYATGQRCRWHASDYTYQLTDGTFTDKSFVQPTMTITAIGDGPGIVPSTGMNVVKTSFSTQLSLDAPPSIPGIEIEPARLVIKPTATDSVIELKFSILKFLHQGDIS